MLSFDKLDKYDDLDVTTAAPNVGADLLAAYTAGQFDGLPADRLMAALELLRHGEITTEQAAEFAGVSRDQLTGLLRKLAISADM